MQDSTSAAASSQRTFTHTADAAMHPQLTHANGYITTTQHPQFIDLNSTQYNIKGLKYCRNVGSLVSEYLLANTPPASEENLNSDSNCTTPKEPPSNVLIFDLSPNESAIPSLFTVSSPASSLSTLLFNHSKSSLASARQRFYKFHLNLPSTLLRRKNCKFESLLQVTFTDEKRMALLKLISTCNVFIFFDKLSIYSNCSIQTHALIAKFKHFLELQNKQDSELVLLSLDANGVGNSTTSPSLTQQNGFMDQQVQDTNANNSAFVNHQRGKNKKKPGMNNFNLTLKIPKKSSHSMFVQSIKKDAVHYSPTSLKKYFQFNIPETLEKDDPVLPRWLQPFTDKENKSNILIKLLDNFELLEDIEVRRLSDCLDTKKQCSMGENEECKCGGKCSTDGTQSAPAAEGDSPHDLQTSKSYHKIYSLTHLQKQFKKQKVDLAKCRGSLAARNQTQQKRVSTCSTTVSYTHLTLPTN